MTRRRWMVVLGALVAVTLSLAACVTATIHLSTAPVMAGSAVAVEALAVPLNANDPSRSAIDGFRYAGGVALTSTQTSRFHGLSDLVVKADGRVFSVSDDGDQVTGRLVLDANGRLAGLADVRLASQTGLDGQRLQGKEWGDAEGLTLLPDGRRMVSFEHHHRVWLYPTNGGPPVAAPMPNIAMAANDGMEGLAAGNGGYWVGVESGTIWFCRLQADCRQLKDLPKPPPGYRLSSLTTGPNGELVILHHSYIPAIGSRVLVAIVRNPMKADEPVDAFPMAPPLTTDNFEGVAVVAQANGDWRIYLLSDDNFSVDQRTLLLAFDWTPPK